ncbi:MAG: hypothetical protein GY832_11210 [Chloroflexi bacterium]|nr:hypothetical protein [Chloroflexota bacterium]
MEVKLYEVVEAEGALDRLFGCHPKKAQDGFRVAQIKRELAPILSDYRAARQRLLEQHAVKSKTEPDRWLFVKVDENGDPILEYAENDKEKKHGRPVTDVAAFEAFSEELDEFCSSETVKVEGSITLAQIQRLGLEPAMTPDEMALLWWLIKEFDEDAKV